MKRYCIALLRVIPLMVLLMGGSVYGVIEFDVVFDKKFPKDKQIRRDVMAGLKEYGRFFKDDARMRLKVEPYQGRIKNALATMTSPYVKVRTGGKEYIDVVPLAKIVHGADIGGRGYDGTIRINFRKDKKGKTLWDYGIDFKTTLFHELTHFMGVQAEYVPTRASIEYLLNSCYYRNALALERGRTASSGWEDAYIKEFAGRIRGGLKADIKNAKTMSEQFGAHFRYQCFEKVISGDFNFAALNKIFKKGKVQDRSAFYRKIAKQLEASSRVKLGDGYHFLTLYYERSTYTEHLVDEAGVSIWNRGREVVDLDAPVRVYFMEKGGRKIPLRLDASGAIDLDHVDPSRECLMNHANSPGVYHHKLDKDSRAILETMGYRLRAVA